MKQIGIIGTAGRNTDYDKLDLTVLREMLFEAEKLVGDFAKEEKVMLISGGAAWADFIAVEMFLSNPKDRGLTLCLPSYFNLELCCFDEGRGTQTQQKHARITNYYHDRFTRKTDYIIFPLDDIKKAIERGAHVIVRDGFFARNKDIAKLASDLLIAFTFGENDIPLSKGTLNTWNQSKAEIKTHISINTLL